MSRKKDTVVQCRRCHRQLIDWKVINPEGQLIGFMTCPIYCDRRCHMCGATLQIKTTKSLVRTVKCKQCLWIDTCDTDPTKRQEIRRRPNPKVKPDEEANGYRRLSAEELRIKLEAHRLSSRTTVCNSCGITISVNGLCGCS